MQNDRDTWIQNQLQSYHSIDRNVIEFIANVRFRYDQDELIIVDLFESGYCYYFAVMLQTAFCRGTICLSYRSSHIVFVDEDNRDFKMCTAYDINGVYTSYNENSLIPVDIFGEGMIDFMHVPNIEFDANSDWIKSKVSL